MRFTMTFDDGAVFILKMDIGIPKGHFNRNVRFLLAATILNVSHFKKKKNKKKILPSESHCRFHWNSRFQHFYYFFRCSSSSSSVSFDLKKNKKTIRTRINSKLLGTHSTIIVFIKLFKKTFKQRLLYVYCFENWIPRKDIIILNHLFLKRNMRKNLFHSNRNWLSVAWKRRRFKNFIVSLNKSLWIMPILALLKTFIFSPPLPLLLPKFHFNFFFFYRVVQRVWVVRWCEWIKYDKLYGELFRFSYVHIRFRFDFSIWFDDTLIC